MEWDRDYDTACQQQNSRRDEQNEQALHQWLAELGESYKPERLLCEERSHREMLLLFSVYVPGYHPDFSPLLAHGAPFVWVRREECTLPWTRHNGQVGVFAPTAHNSLTGDASR